MAEVVWFSDAVRARRAARERECTAHCVQILEANLRLALHLFATGPHEERPVRARQVRQLAELFEYVVERER